MAEDRSARQRFRDLSLRRKLMVIIMATTSLSLLLGGGALIAHYANEEEAKVTERMITLAKVVTGNISAAVSFQEPLAAKETLSALSAEPSVLAASVFDRRGALFARYVSPKAAGDQIPTDAMRRPDALSTTWRKSGSLFRDDRLLVTGPILLDGELIGGIEFETDMRLPRMALLSDIGILSLIIVGAGMMALFLSSALERIISRPIVHLAETMRQVSLSKDYRTRAHKPGNDEIGALFDGFNEMLGQISERDLQLETRRSQLEDAQRIAKMGNWMWNSVSDRMSLSKEVARLLGIDAGTFEGSLEDYLRMVHPDDRTRVANAFRLSVASNCPLDISHRIQFKGLETRYLHLLGEPKSEGAGQATCITGSAQDVTDRALADEQLRIAANALESTGDSILITDNRLNIVSVNRAFTVMNQYARDTVLGRNPEFMLAPQHDGGFLEEVLREVAATGQWRGEVWGRRANGEIYPQLMSINEVKDAVGAVSHFVFVGSDISHYKQYEKKLKFLAGHDVLTQLPNRGLYLDKLKEALARARRQSLRLAVMFLDLDRFKEVNDTLGHEIGDELLQAAASRITHCLRSCDIVARQGGDEFTVLLDSLDTPTDAATVAGKLVETLSRPFHIADRDLFISASIGIACYPVDGADEDTLLKNADIAMYSAKQQGGNGYRFFADGNTQPILAASSP